MNTKRTFRIFPFCFVFIALFSHECDIDKYLSVLDQYPEVGRLGSYKQGEIEIVRDPKRIKEISDLQKARFQKQGLSEEEAISASRIGVIMDDTYWMFIRDAVIFPTGAEGSYNRIIRKSGIEDGLSGIAILPILPDNRIVLNINFRHATRSWELEVPRGARKLEETLEDAAQRELEEETGLLVSKQHFLGNMAHDTGACGSTIAVYLGFVDKKGMPNQDYSEAILKIETFSPGEIKEALQRGWLEREIKGKKERVWVRDGFLTYALYQAENQGLLQKDGVKGAYKQEIPVCINHTANL